MRRDAVRRAALALPEVEERETWDTATFRVRNKIFVMFSQNERHLWVKSTHDEQAALVATDPETFFVPPYVGPSGWIGLVVNRADSVETRELITEAWRMTAPKRLVRSFDEAAG